MGEKRVIAQVASNVVHNDDWFLKDSPTQDTSKISATNLKAILGADGTQALSKEDNAIAEDYDSASTYNKDDFAFYENKLYRCLANNTTGTWDGTKWEEFDLPTVLITTAHNIETAEFTIGTYYSADDLVLKDGKLYQCVVGHNATEWKSQFWRSVTIDEMLGYLSDSIAPEHNPSTVYAVGDLVTHNKALWRCIQAGAGAFVNANWENVTVSALIAEAGQIDDVQVKTTGDYETVVENKIAKIDLSSVTAYGEVPNLPQAIATFKDGADAPMKSLKVAIEPQQDLHGYDAPWIGGAGKNKFDVDLPHEEVSGSVTYLYELTLKPNTAYTMSSNVPQGNPASLYFNGGSTNVNGVWNGTPRTFTSDENGTLSAYVRFSASQGGIDLYTAVKNGQYYIQLEEGETATSFAPYSNICPISGWTACNITRSGKNLIPYVELGILNKTDGSEEDNYDNKRTGFIRTLPNTQYTISGLNGSDISIRIFEYKKDKSYIRNYVSSNITNSVTIQTGAEVGYIRFQGNKNIFTTNVAQCEKGTTATTYEPYNGQTYTIDLDGTRYGGEVDVVNGIMTVNRAYASLGSLTWTKRTDYGEGSYFLSQELSDKLAGSYDFICSQYKVVQNRNYITATSQIAPANNTNSKDLVVRDDRYSDTTTFKNAVNGVQLVYELDTPLTIQLTPTAVKSLLGTNNVWADTGDINECVYRRDISSTIDDILARLEALEG